MNVETKLKVIETSNNNYYLGHACGVTEEDVEWLISQLRKEREYVQHLEKLKNGILETRLDLEKENEQLKSMLATTQNDMQIVRDNLNRTHSSMENAIHNYFERVKEVEPR